MSVTQSGYLSGSGGYRLLTARVKGDTLPGDNRFDKLVLIRDKVRVLVVDGDRSDRPDTPSQAEYGSDYVEAALAPNLERSRNRAAIKQTGIDFIRPEV